MRISVTKIEQYRRYRAGLNSLADLLESITGAFRPSWQMERGTAFHSILEEPALYMKWGSGLDGRPEVEFHYECDGLPFPADVVHKCTNVIDYSGAFEMKTVKEFVTEYGVVNVVGKCDQVIGTKVIENKTKWSPFDYDGYADSCQWRFYLSMFNVSEVKYNVFCMSISRGEVELKSIEVFSMFDYATLEYDVMELLTDFVHFIITQNLQHYFEDKYELAY